MTASWDRTARLWPLGGGEARTLDGHADRLSSVAVGPDGSALATGSWDGTVIMWDPETGRETANSGLRPAASRRWRLPDRLPVARATNERPPGPLSRTARHLAPASGTTR